ncbi:MAG: acyl-CoA dehydrogenase [Micrococcales bacterium]|nr:acyl-CoA dehydrogenase [Micrococcales bacterium]
MDFTIDSEQRALRDAAADLAERHAPDYGSGDVTVGPAEHDAGLWAALAGLGGLGLPFPEAAGGFGASPVEVSLVAGELGRAGIRSAYGEALVAASLLVDADQTDLVGAVADGAALVIPALAEPGRAWSLAASTVAAEGSGTGPDAWTLTGIKEPVQFAAAASHIVVPAQAPDGLAVLLVSGPKVTANGRVELAGAAATLLIGPDTAASALARAVNLGIVALAGEAVGAMDTAMTMTVDYLKTRKQFGVPLMTFQTLTQRAADMYVSLELARSSAQFAAMAITDDPDDSASISRAKVVIGQSGRHIGQEAIQLHGGIGMTAEYAVGHLMTRLTAIEHTFGDTRQHLAALAAHVGDHESVDVLA